MIFIHKFSQIISQIFTNYISFLLLIRVNPLHPFYLRAIWIYC